MKDTTLQENKLVAVYGRVSTSNQEEQKTIEAQLSEVREFAKKNNFTIVKEYLDQGWSGDILARPELDKLRNDAKNKIWQAVLIYDPDRLGRQLFYQQIVIDELKQVDVEVLFVTMPPIKSPSDQLMFGIRGLFAEYEKTKISERFRIGKINRANNGHILTTEAPYGYTYILNKGKRGNSDYVAGHYEINETEAQIVKSIFSWIADDGMTLRGVVRRLQDLGVRPRKSKRGVWSTSTLSTLLRNKTYIGEAHYGASYAVVPINPLKNEGYKKIKKTSRRMKPEDEWIKIETPSIIDEDLFNRVHKRLRDNFESSVRNTKNEYLVAHKIWCPCGCRRAGEGPQKGKHLYYRCTSRVKNFPLTSDCKEGGLNARIVDSLVWNKLSHLMSSQELMEKQLKRWIESKNDSAASTISIQGVEKEIAKLKIQEDRYVKAYGAGAISVEQLKEFTHPIRERASELCEQLIRARSETSQLNAAQRPKSDQIKEFAAAARLALTDLNFEAKQGIVKALVEKIVGTRSNLQVYGYIPVNKDINVFTISRHGLNTSRHDDSGFIPFYFAIKLPPPLQRGIDYGFRALK